MADGTAWAFENSRDKSYLLSNGLPGHINDNDSYKLESHGLLRSLEKVAEASNIYSEGWADCHAVAVDTKIVLVKDSQEQSPVVLTFENTVDVIQWSPDGLFLVIGDRSGTVHFVHRQTGVIAFSKKLVEAIGDTTYLNVHISPGHKGASHLVALTANYAIKVCANLKFDCLHDALLQNSKTKIQSAVANVVFSSFVVEGMASEPLLAVPVCLEREPAVVVVGRKNTEIVLWKKPPGGSYRPAGHIVDTCSGGVRDAQVLGNRYLLCVVNDSRLVMYDLLSLTEVRHWAMADIDSFCLIYSALPYCKRLEDVRLATLSNELEGSSLTITQLSDGTTIYSQRLPGNCWLPKAPVVSGDLRVVASVAGDGQTKQRSTCLFICSITEAAPLERYKRLLKQNSFEAAKVLAVAHGLDLMLLRSAKIAYLIERLIGNDIAATGGKVVDGSVGRETLDQLLAELDGVEDLSFVLDTCLSVRPPSLDTAFGLMRYAQRRLENQPLQRLGPAISKRACSVLEQMRRMETYRLAFSGRSSLPSWQDFCKGEIVEEALRLLRFGDFTTFVIIFERHKGDLHGRMSDDILKNILSSIPSDAIPYTILHSVIKATAEILHAELPSGFEMLSLWLQQLIGNLERDPAFPDNALELIGVVANEARGLHEALAAERRLSTQTGQLHSLGHLHRKYGLQMTFAQFITETKQSVAFRLLDQGTALDSLAKLIAQPLQQYAKETMLQRDEILLDYLKESLRRRDKRISYLPEATWEGRAVAVIDHISNPTLVVDAILAVLPACHTPWTPAIRNLAQKALLFSDPRMAEVEMRIQQDKLSGLLEKYGVFQELSIVNVDMKLFIKQVLSSSKKDCVTDALALADFSRCMSRVEVYCIRGRHLLLCDQDEECCALVLSSDLVKREQSIVVRKLIEFCALYVDDIKVHLGVLKNDTRPRRLLLGKAALLLIARARKLFDASETRHYKKLQAMLRRIVSLQVDYAIIISTAELQEQNCCTKVFRRYLGDHVKGMDGQPCLPGSRAVLAQLRRLRRLLGLQMSSDLDIALCLIDMDEIVPALEICCDFVRTESTATDDCSGTAYAIIRQLLLNGSSSTEAVVSRVCELSRLASRAAAWCSAGTLPSCNQLASIWDLILATHRNSTVYCDQWSSNVPSSLWHHFGENNLIVDHTSMLSKCWKYAACLMPPRDESSPCHGRRYYAFDTVQGRRIAAQNDEKLSSASATSLAVSTAALVTMLKEAGHQMLALRCVATTLFVVLDWLSIQSPDDVVRNPKLQERSWKVVKLGCTEMKELSEKVLNKMLAERHVDHDLALGFMCMLPMKPVYSLLVEQISAAANTSQQFARVLSLASLSEAYGKLTADDTILTLSASAKTEAEWACRLAKDHVSYKGVFMKPSSRKSLLPHIVERCSLTTLLDFCECCTSDVDIDDVLQRRLNKIITAHNSAIALLAAASYCDREQSSLLRDIEFLLSRASGEGIRKKMLQTLVSQASPYNYELLFFAYERLVMLDPEDSSLCKGMMLLKYLLPYQRVSARSVFEIDHADASTEGLATTTDLLVSRRLPFHSLLGTNCWKILTGELNEQTVEPLLAVAGLLKLSPDQVYVAAVQNMAAAFMDTRTGAPKSAPVSTLGTSSFLEKAEVLLRNVKDNEMAVACMQWIAQFLHEGSSERVQALRFSVALARDWCTTEKRSDTASRAREALDRLTVSYHEAAVAHLLSRHGLQPAAYSSVASDAEALVEALYSDKDLEQFRVASNMLTYVGRSVAKADIFAIVEEVSKIFGVSMEKLSKSLAKSWLGSVDDEMLPAADDLNSSMTVIASLNMSLSPTVHNDKPDICTDGLEVTNKVVAILRHIPIDSAVVFLFDVAFRDQMVDEAIRFRALKCLLAICKMEDLERLTGLRAADYSKRYDDLDLLMKLRKFRATYSLNSLAQCGKDTIIRNLWQRHRSEPQGLELVCELCMKYRFTDVSFVSGLLQQLADLHLLACLEKLLPWCLAVEPELIRHPSYRAAWSRLLLTTFDRCVGDANDGGLGYADFFTLLIRCPIAHQINLAKVRGALSAPGFEACALLLDQLCDPGRTAVSPDRREVVLRQCQLWKPTHPLLAAQMELQIRIS